MKTMKRSECAVLPLVLQGKWFDMIAIGQKKEEYREHSEYWATRIENWEARARAAGEQMVLEFRLGYAKDAPRMAFLLPNNQFFDRHRAYLNHPEWGEPFEWHFVLPIGERVELVEDGK